MAGDCIMPREGIFGRVLEGGKIRCGDIITFVDQSSFSGGEYNDK
jgi:MOSC domain-containing protein YiiM